MLTTYDWIYGISQISAVVLALVAALIALSLFSAARRIKYLHAWKWMIPALLFFVVVEILGVLRTFGVFSSPFLTHILPGVILGFLFVALVVQTNINRGWIK